MLYKKTLPAAATRALVTVRLSITSAATRTQQLATARYLTKAVTTTSHWATEPASTSTQAVTTSISAALVILARAVRSVSATKQIRQQPSSPASMEKLRETSPVPR